MAVIVLDANSTAKLTWYVIEADNANADKAYFERSLETDETWSI